MTLLVAVMLIATALSGLAVVLSRDPRRQVFALGAHGAVLTVLFMVLEAPDVALSELAVGVVAVPLMVLVAIAATDAQTRDR